METSTQLAHRLREVFLDGKWIANTNWRDALANVTWEQATQQVESLNTIAALTFHLNYYLAGVADFFESGALEIRDKYSFDLPAIESEKDWDDLRNTLFNSAERFAGLVEQMSGEELAQVFLDEKYGDYRRNIEGMIEHGYYHLGQVSLIKKML